jgi:hypothetical protein
MKAKDAARIFNNLPDEVLLPVAQKMKPDLLALVLANMNPDTAKTLTVKLAGMLTLPQTAGVAAPAMAAADPVTAQAASNSDAETDAEQPTPAPATTPRARRPAPPKQVAEEQPTASPEARKAVQAASAPAAAAPAAAAPATPAAATAPKDTAPPKG